MANSVDSIHGQWTMPGGADERAIKASRLAHQSSASSRSGAKELTDRGGKGSGECAELITSLTEAWAMVWRLGDGGEVAVGMELVGGSA
jgi:hypothetical protein